MAEIQEKKMVFTTKLVDDATEKLNDGIVVKRYQNPWLKSEVGLKRSGITFRMTTDEQSEYIKCALNIDYFAENYCNVKTEDGTVNKINLRGYQKKILDSFVNHKNTILMSSRQSGKCFSFNTICSFKINDTIIDIRIGKLYYTMLSKERKLTFLEKIKVKLYDMIFNLGISQ